MNDTVLAIVISVAALALVIARQVLKRPVKEDGRPVVLLVLAVVGVVQLVRFLSDHAVTATAVAMLATSLVLAAGFGALRAYTVRLWRDNGVLYRQGTALTIVLWLVAVGLHFGADLLIGGGAQGSAGGLASAALLLYVAVSFGVQRVVVLSRTRSMARSMTLAR